MLFSSKNKIAMNYHLHEVDFNANGNFTSIQSVDWIVGDKKIITPYGNLKVCSAKIVEQNGLVGVQFSVKGELNLSSMPMGRVLNIATIAFMRQPYNAWLWAYAFDKNRVPIANFCGYDDLDGLASFVSQLENL